MSKAVSDTVQIFVGTDRSQKIGLQVLEYSIGKHTQRPFKIHSLENVKLSEPKDKRQAQRTGFSFSRFAIPELMNHQGKAIYMDADMLVFNDIGLLWDIPFNGRKMLIQEDVPSQTRKLGSNPFKRESRAKQCSVSLLDCETLGWNAEEIVAGLDGHYSYKELMSELCILDESELGYDIPGTWNSLEHWDSNTSNIHYTDMHTQPWVYPLNENGYLWIDTVREMLAQGELSEADIEGEIADGYARPSLLLELQHIPSSEESESSRRKRMADYEQYDVEQGFVKHKATFEAKRQRELAEKNYVAALSSKTFNVQNVKPDVIQFSASRPLRILFVANAANLPTLQLAFTKPLQRLESAGEIQYSVLDELMIGAHSRIRLLRQPSWRAYVKSVLNTQQPDLVVFCRYSGLMADFIVDEANRRGIRSICCVDDDLLNVPTEIGDKKFAYHNDPVRKQRLRYLLDNSDLIYTSTEALTKRLQSYDVQAPIHTASVFCPAEVNADAPERAENVFGYMGFGHECDIEVALPGIVATLQHNQNARFELFGTIPKPAALEQFGERVVVLEPDWDYEKFLSKLSQRRWSVGICPLANLPFNDYKVSTKWLEYTSDGVAVIASKHPVYEDVLSGDCGVLVKNSEDWSIELPALLADKPRRLEMVQNAQSKQRERFGFEKFEGDFLGMLKPLQLVHVANGGAEI